MDSLPHHLRYRFGRHRNGRIRYTSLLKEMMDTRLPFSVQDVVDHIEHQYPGYDIDMDKLLYSLVLLVVIGQLPSIPLVERYEHLPFKGKRNLRSLSGSSTILQPLSKRMAIGIWRRQTCIIKSTYDVEHGVLYIMRLFNNANYKRKTHRKI